MIVEQQQGVRREPQMRLKQLLSGDPVTMIPAWGSIKARDSKHN